ncbi:MULTISPECIES: hypothetical protein [unclassified Modestobacter]|uniref:hypothetical protein n=1 Tax=unclassified Modestobacter TaxID=2643866 RepID=UPI0022AA1143|nr:MULTISPECIES: hypothetical protein [unclassified Modestobacter]MCZ2824250.1 hypothetical protein [Modestobacter sp. VKM Ac-2981]MCZ2854222.1 hypothetical protein [Modestobacter sp. VKM Ac-2982]
MIAALHAEWVKATTLRSTWVCLAGFAVAVTGISAAVVGAIGDLQAAEPDYDAGLLAFYGLNFGHVAVIVVAVLLTAGEYGRQTVHDALVAVPRRGVFLVSKVAVGAALVLATATVTALVSAVVTQALLGPAGVGLSELARPTVAAALYPTLLAVLCMGVAMVMRDQTGALGLLVPFFFLVSPLARAGAGAAAPRGVPPRPRRPGRRPAARPPDRLLRPGHRAHRAGPVGRGGTARRLVGAAPQGRLVAPISVPTAGAHGRMAA